jgi:Wzt C-terminal domain
MIQVDADILLIDEVLAVGDAAFQQKCFDVFHRMKDERKTILFVTHDMASVKRFCDRAVLLERGELKMIGKPTEIADNYVEINFGRGIGAQDDGEPRYGDRSAEIVEAWFEDEHGERQTALPQGRPCTVRMRVEFKRPVEDPVFAVVFENDQGQPLFAASTDRSVVKTGSYGPGEEAVFAVSLENVFAPGRIYASPWVRARSGGDPMDRRPRIASLVVTGSHESGGLVDLPHDVSLEHAGETVDARASSA